MFGKEKKKDDKEEVSQETKKKRSSSNLFGFKNKFIKVFSRHSGDSATEKKIGRHVLGGRWRDKDPRTKNGLKWYRIYRGTLIVGIIGVVAMIVGRVQYHIDSVSNSTPFGYDLTFSQSGATIELKGVHTYEDREITVVEFGYDESAKAKLSLKGTNYGINLGVSNKNNLPKGLKTTYGILGREGNGYLIIKGKLKNEAYQFFILNRFTFDTGGQSGVYQNNQDRLEKKSTENIIAGASLDSADDNGILDFLDKKPSSGASQDYINFRVNPYSKNTIIHKGSGLTKNGKVDYNKVFHDIGITPYIAENNEVIKETQEKMKQNEKAISEYTDRLLESADDADAASQLKIAQENYKVNKELIDGLKDQNKSLTELVLSRDNLVEPNDELNVVVMTGG